MATEQTLNASLLDDYNEASEQTYQAILTHVGSPNAKVRDEALESCKAIALTQRQLNRLKLTLAESEGK